MTEGKAYILTIKRRLVKHYHSANTSPPSKVAVRMISPDEFLLFNLCNYHDRLKFRRDFVTWLSNPYFQYLPQVGVRGFDGYVNKVRGPDNGARAWTNAGQLSVGACVLCCPLPYLGGSFSVFLRWANH